MKRIAIATVLLAAWSAPVARAQHSEEADSGPKSHGRTFSTGPREGWTFSSPHVDFAGGVHLTPDQDNSSEGFFRLHMLTAAGPKLVELEVDLLWLPALGATPTLAAVLQLAPAQMAFRTPIHELSPFISVGRALVDDAVVELQFGVAHPLAPYLLHFP
jgi:hypothetical protein